MFLIPFILSLVGVLAGPPIAQAMHNCPHRGKVWGAFLTPLLAAFYAPLQILALAASLGGALGAGLTAHRSLAISVCSVLAINALLTAGLYNFY
jgi:hypothetical protein